MSFLPQNNYRAHQRRLLPRSFLVMGILVLVIIGINYLTLGSVSSLLHKAGEPLWKSQAGILGAFKNISAGLTDKKALQQEIERLRKGITLLRLASLETEILREENKEFRMLLNRETVAERVAAAILARPHQTLYDTFVVDVGRRDGITKSARVFGVGDTAVGSVEEVYARTSLISLYSTPGRSIEVLLGNDNGDGPVATEAIGRGGGDFEIRLPRGIEVLEGHAISLPGLGEGLGGGIFGVIEEIIASPSDSFQTILFSSPINIQSLRFVTIELR